MFLLRFLVVRLSEQEQELQRCKQELSLAVTAKDGGSGIFGLFNKDSAPPLPATTQRPKRFEKYLKNANQKNSLPSIGKDTDKSNNIHEVVTVENRFSRILQQAMYGASGGQDASMGDRYQQLPTGGHPPLIPASA